MLTEDQELTLMKLCETAQQQLYQMSEKFTEGEEKLRINRELLRQSTEDIHLLLAFIKSKGLQPPKLQSKFIN